MTQPTNKCYRKTYVNDTSIPDGVITPEIVRGDTVPVTDLGIEREDAFGNKYYDLVKNYVRSGLYNGQKDSSGNIINQQTIPGATGNDNYIRCSYTPILDANGKLVGNPCVTTGAIPTPVPGSPASCAIFLQDAEAWNRTNDTCGPVTDRVEDADGRTLVAKANTPEPYVERDVDNELFVNDCTPRNPFTVLVPVDAGGLTFTYMNGDFILTVEGDQVLSAPNTTILVAEEGNV